MKSNKKILIISGIVLLLVLGGAGGFLTFNKKESDSVVETAEPEEGYLTNAKDSYDKAKADNVKDADELFDVEIDFEVLKQTNPDVVGWIKIP